MQKIAKLESESLAGSRCIVAAALELMRLPEDVGQSETVFALLVLCAHDLERHMPINDVPPYAG